MARTRREDRFINPDLRRSFRKSYNVQEVKWGLLACVGLIAVFAWVLWKGARPDPELFGRGVGLLVDGGGNEGRGVLPEPLAPSGWTEAAVSRFGPDNLYEKINGREGFYKSFGFKELIFASLIDDSDSSRVIDIELYDLGDATNAVGCYAAERQPDVETAVEDDGLSHIARNGLFLTRGPFYIRAIASDETATSLGALEALKTTLKDLESAPLPWGYRLFALEPQIETSTVEAFQNDAFSFSFGRNVFTAGIGAGETRVFVTPTGDDPELAARYARGFAELGEARTGSIAWSVDPYLNEFSGAADAGPWVVGVRNAPDVEAAERALTLIRATVARADDRLLNEAQHAASANTGSADYEASESSADEAGVENDTEPDPNGDLPESPEESY